MLVVIGPDGIAIGHKVVINPTFVLITPLWKALHSSFKALMKSDLQNLQV
jgi:hypothetical protein